MHACAVTVFRFLLISQLSCRACGSSNVSLRIYIYQLLQSRSETFINPFPDPTDAFYVYTHKEGLLVVDRVILKLQLIV